MRVVSTVARVASGLLVGVSLCALSGCMIFNQPPATAYTSEKTLLKPIQMPADAIELEIRFVERPVNDPLLGRALWTELDQLAGIHAEERIALRENGFRVALAGTEAPPKLASLLEAGREDEYDELTGFWTNKRLALRRGHTSEVHCSIDASDWSTTIYRDGVGEAGEFSDARGILRVNLEDIRDGWVKVHIQPEIHHGEGTVRRKPSEAGWNLSSGQAIEPLAGSGFTLHLSLNEMVVISADDESRGRAGNLFFRREDDGRLMQRVIVLRVADLTRFEVASR